MNVLVLNSGSSSLKFQFLNVVKNDVIFSGVCERIGINEAEISVKFPVKNLKEILRQKYLL